MTTKKTNDNRASNRGSRRRVNNPDGNNQYSGPTGVVRKNPFASAAAIGTAVATGVFLWSRRNEIGDKVNNLSEQINDWRETPQMERGSARAEAGNDAFMASSTSETRGDERSQVEIAQEALTLKELGTTA